MRSDSARSFGILPQSASGTASWALTEGVAAVERALSILDAFTDQDPQLSLAELAKRTKHVQEHRAAARPLARELRLPRSRRGWNVPARLEGAAAGLAVPAAPPHGGSRTGRAARDRRRTEGRRVLLRSRRRPSALPASRRRACARCATRSTRATACRSTSARPATSYARSAAAAAQTTRRSATRCTRRRSASAIPRSPPSRARCSA